MQYESKTSPKYDESNTFMRFKAVQQSNNNQLSTKQSRFQKKRNTIAGIAANTNSEVDLNVAQADVSIRNDIVLPKVQKKKN